jgi:hypothetical protein
MAAEVLLKRWIHALARVSCEAHRRS